MAMRDELTKVVGLTVASFEIHASYDGEDHSFTLIFSDGTQLDVSSRCYNNGTSDVTVDFET